MEKFTIIVGDFNMPLLVTNTTDKKIRTQIFLKKQLAVLSSWTEHHTAIIEYTFLGIHGTLTKTDFLGHKASINTFQRIEIKSMFFTVSTKPEISNKKITKNLSMFVCK